MKKILILVSFAICIILYSCHKDTRVIPNNFYFTANKAGSDWGAQASASAIPGDSLLLTAFKPIGEEHINFHIKFNGTGTDTLTGNQAEFFTTVGMDAITSHFKLDSTQTSWITITSYSKSTHIISGTFQLNLLENTVGFTGYNPFTFRDGLFRVKLPD